MRRGLQGLAISIGLILVSTAPSLAVDAQFPTPLQLKGATLSWPVPTPGGIPPLISQSYAEFGDGVADQHHTGLDIAVPLPTKVYPAFDGEIVLVQGNDSTPAQCPRGDHRFGYTLIIKHEAIKGRPFYTQYSHLDYNAQCLEATSSADCSLGIEKALRDACGSLAALPEHRCAMPTINGKPIRVTTDPNVIASTNGPFRLIAHSGCTGFEAVCGVSSATCPAHLHFELKDFATLTRHGNDPSKVCDNNTDASCATDADCGGAGTCVNDGFGYSVRYPDQDGYHDPMLNLYGAAPTCGLELVPTAAGLDATNGLARLVRGPHPFYDNACAGCCTAPPGCYDPYGAFQAGETYRVVDRVESSSCPGDWVLLQKTNGQTFDDTSPDGVGTLKFVWACRGDGTKQFLTPPFNEPAAQCVYRKYTATAKYTDGLIKCYRNAIKDAQPAVDPACLNKADADFSKKFAAAEAIAGCEPGLNEATVKQIANDYVNETVSAVSANEQNTKVLLKRLIASSRTTKQLLMACAKERKKPNPESFTKKVLNAFRNFFKKFTKTQKDSTASLQFAQLATINRTVFATTSDVVERNTPACALIGNEFQINSYTTGDQSTGSQVKSRTVGMLRDGGFDVAWRSAWENGDRIFTRVFDPSGIPTGTSLLDTSTGDHDVTTPAVALDGGRFAVVWSTYGAFGYPSRFDVFGRTMPSGQSEFSTEFLINSYTTGSQYWSSVAHSSVNNEFVVTWSSEYDPTASNTSLFFRRYADDATPIGPAQPVNPGSGDSPGVIEALSDGGFVVTWHQQNNGGAGYSVYGRRFDPNMAPLGGTFSIGQMGEDPSLATTADGSLIVAWEDESPFGGITVRRFDGSGIPLGPEFQASSQTDGANYYPMVAANDDGGFVVVWRDYGTASGVIARCFDPAGVPTGPEFRVDASPDNSASYPSISANGSGKFVVTWNASDGSGTGVFGRRLSTTP